MRKALVAGLYILLSFPVFSQRDNKKDTLYFATYTYSINTRMANLQPLATHLAASTGYTIVAVSYPTVQRLIEAIIHDSVDFAMMNTSGYLTLQRKNPGIVLPVVNLEMGMDSVTNYGGCLIAAKSTGIRSIEQLRNPAQKYSLALVNSSSTSGNLVPRLLLNKEGISSAESIFSIYYAGTHRRAVEDVLNEKAGLAGCGCAEIDSARTRHVFDEKAVVIGSFNDIPLGPVVGSKRLDKKIKEAIGKALLRVHIDNAPVFRNFCAGWTEFKQAVRFKPVTDNAYDSFRKMFGDNIDLWRMIE